MGKRKVLPNRLTSLRPELGSLPPVERIRHPIVLECPPWSATVRYDGRWPLPCHQAGAGLAKLGTPDMGITCLYGGRLAPRQPLIIARGRCREERIGRLIGILGPECFAGLTMVDLDILTKRTHHG